MKKILIIVLISLFIVSLIVGAAFLRSKLLIVTATRVLTHGSTDADPFADQIRIGGLGRFILLFYAFALLIMGIIYAVEKIALQLPKTIISNQLREVIVRRKETCLLYAETCGPGASPSSLILFSRPPRSFAGGFYFPHSNGTSSSR